MSKVSAPLPDPARPEAPLQAAAHHHDPELTTRLVDVRRRLIATGARLQSQLDRCDATLRVMARRQRARAARGTPADRITALLDARTYDAVAAAMHRCPGSRMAERPGTAGARLVIDRDRLSAVVDGQRRLLTPTEWQLLGALVARPGEVLSRGELAARAWGPGYRSRGSEVEVYISRLRRKLGESRRGGLIQTVRGRGYRLVTDELVDGPG